MLILIKHCCRVQLSISSKTKLLMVSASVAVMEPPLHQHVLRFARSDFWYILCLVGFTLVLTLLKITKIVCQVAHSS